MPNLTEVQPAPTLDAKSAVRVAMDYLGYLYPPQVLEELLPEEVELSEDGRYWLVTLGFKSVTTSRTLAQALHGIDARTYKVFEVDAQSGTVKSMKIRSLS